MDAMKLKKVKPKINKGDMFFYCVFLAWPVLQFAVFYIGVNFNSILMSFKELNEDTNVITYGLGSYKWVFKDFMGDAAFKDYLGLTLKGFAVTSLISTPLGLLFAYYIYKKLFGWGAFRVILFLPQIISGVVIAVIFRFFVNDYVPQILPSVGNLFGDKFEKAAFPMLMFYCIWMGFGTSVLMYSNKMSSIPEEIIESAHLDGAIGLREFWHIVMPLTFSTFSVFLITSVAGLFMNQFGAYELYRHDTSKGMSIGLWFYLQVKAQSEKVLDPQSTPSLFKFAALGIVLTIITIPIALTIRWAVEKFGPSEE